MELGGTITTSILALALATALVPVTASAQAPSCADATAGEAIAAGSTYLLASGTSLEVWEESNPLEGLQTVECADGNGRTIPSDTHVQTLPPALPVPDVNEVGAAAQQLCNDLTPPGMRCAPLI